jgi:hypothetical protein
VDLAPGDYRVTINYTTDLGAQHQIFVCDDGGCHPES